MFGRKKKNLENNAFSDDVSKDAEGGHNKKEHHGEHHWEHHKERHGVRAGLIAIMVFVIIVYLLFYNKEYVLSALEKSPALWQMYTHVMHQVSEKTFLGLFYASAFGSLFFIVFPTEVLFLYYTSLGHNPISIIAITVCGGLLGMFANYIIGLIIGRRVLKLFMRKSFDKISRLCDKFGAVIILLGNMIPSPIEPIAVLFGAARYPMKKFIFLTVLGKTAKFVLLLLGRNYFLDVVLPWIKGLI